MMFTETETLTSTLHYNIFTYLDYVFSATFILLDFIHIYLHIYKYIYICVCVCVCVCVSINDSLNICCWVRLKDIELEYQ